MARARICSMKVIKPVLGSCFLFKKGTGMKTFNIFSASGQLLKRVRAKSVRSAGGFWFFVNDLQIVDRLAVEPNMSFSLS